MLVKNSPRFTKTSNAAATLCTQFGSSDCIIGRWTNTLKNTRRVQMWFQKAFSEGWDVTTSARQSWWAQSAPGDTSFLLWGCSLQGSDHTSHTPCRRCTSSSWWRSFGLDQLLRSQVSGRSSRSLKMTKSAERKVTFGQNLDFAIGMIDMMRLLRPVTARLADVVIIWCKKSAF